MSLWLLYSSISQRKAAGVATFRGNSKVFWFNDMVSLSLWVANKVLAGWLACMVVELRLMGLMEFECRSLISQLWWLADRSWWIAEAEGSPDSHAWLMNCEMRQTYKSCGQPRPGLTPTSYPRCSNHMTVSFALLKSIFHPDWGNVGCSVGHHRHISPSLGTWPEVF